MLTIRSERACDEVAIRDVNARAFGQPAEAELVRRIRASCGFDPALSRVAVIDDPVDGADVVAAREPGDRIVGHILLSPVHIETDGGGTAPALALAPMAVLPEYQRRGVGSELVRAALAAATRAGHRIIVVLGHPEYYPRFGFQRASDHGIRPPFDVPDEAFMILGLTPDALRGIHGVVQYPPVFRGE